MALYWTGDILLLWATLHAFLGRAPSLPALILGYATAYVLTRRTLPLAGAGVVDFLLPLALSWVSIPLASALVAVFVYRLFNLWLPLAPAVLALAEEGETADLVRASGIGVSIRPDAGGDAFEPALMKVIEIASRSFRPPPPTLYDGRVHAVTAAAIYYSWIENHGDAPFDLSMPFPVPLDDIASYVPAFNANGLVNAIPNVCAARPGILTTADFSHILPPGSRAGIVRGWRIRSGCWSSSRPSCPRS